MPRHPPCALHSLSHKHSTKTTKTRNIASTCTTHTPTNPHPAKPPKQRNRQAHASCDARVHYPVHKQPTHQQPPPTTQDGQHSKEARSHRATSTADPSKLNSVSTPTPLTQPTRSTPTPHPHPQRAETRHR